MLIIATPENQLMRAADSLGSSGYAVTLGGMNEDFLDALNHDLDAGFQFSVVRISITAFALLAMGNKISF